MMLNIVFKTKSRENTLNARGKHNVLPSCTLLTCVGSNVFFHLAKVFVSLSSGCFANFTRLRLNSVKSLTSDRNMLRILLSVALSDTW